MRFLFLNQFVPPDPAPTARLLGDVADELMSRGHEVILVGDGANYRGSKTLLGSRALREGVSLLRLFFRAIAVRHSDVIVCLSSPPLVPVIAGWSRLRHRKAALIHWAMDLYPDVAVALGEVRENSLLHRLTASLMRSSYRCCDLIVVLDGEMAERVGTCGAASEVCPLWPPALPSSVDPEDEPARSDEFTWLYSGNLGRAHEWKTLLDAQHLLEKESIPADLVFQGGGAATVPAKAYAAALGLNRCHWLPYADERDLLSSLLAADCLIVTQRPETSGCLWPSKLALALLLGRPLLWVGETKGGIARNLRDSGHGCFAPGDTGGVAECIKNLLSHRQPRQHDSAPQDIADRIDSARKSGITRLAARFKEIGGGGSGEPL